MNHLKNYNNFINEGKIFRGFLSITNELYSIANKVKRYFGFYVPTMKFKKRDINKKFNELFVILFEEMEGDDEAGEKLLNTLESLEDMLKKTDEYIKNEIQYREDLNDLIDDIDELEQNLKDNWSESDESERWIKPGELDEIQKRLSE
jgi:phosphoglycerate-specific signal transduction histidine kinase